MSESPSITQSQLATYLKCQRLYRYRYERDVEADEQTRALDFGRALHETIREVCDTVRNGKQFTDEEIRTLAEEAFRQGWRSEVSRASYRTASHYEDDRALAREAIEHFFETGDGIEHARRSVAAETRVEFERDGVSYSGYIDNVLRAPEGLELVDYKKSGIDPPVSSRKNYIQLQHDGEYRPQRVKHAIQALIYMEGIKHSKYHDPDDTIAFTYQPLAEAEVDRMQPGMTIEFDTDPVSVTSDVSENREKIWAIIERAVEGIRSGAFEPAPFEEIYDEQCRRCPFRPMCSAHLTSKEFKL